MEKEDPIGEDKMLEAIVEYGMDHIESKAYKVLIMWIERSRKVFPDYNHTKLRRGDPRKSQLFRICYKLVREREFDLKDEEYPLYVRAQLEVLKHIINNNGIVSIDPNCLVGDKAWKRWKLWKSKYDKISKKPKQAELKPTLYGEQKAINGFESTKIFLEKNLKDLSFDNIKKAYDSKKMLTWINLNNISIYYVVVSPFCQKLLKEEDLNKLNFDPNIYKNCITEKAKGVFRRLFPKENLQ